MSAGRNLNVIASGEPEVHMVCQAPWDRETAGVLGSSYNKTDLGENGRSAVL